MSLINRLVGMLSATNAIYDLCNYAADLLVGKKIDYCKIWLQ